MKNTYKNIDEYVATFPPETREILQKLREVIHEAAPDATEDIRYQMPTFRLNDKNLVHFAAYKNHIGFYPTPSVNIAFKKELAPYITGKGTAQFPITKPIPYGIVKKVVQFRVKGIQRESTN